MVTTRRNGASTPSRSLSNPQIQSIDHTTTTTINPQQTSTNNENAMTPLLPTLPEILLLSTHPLLLILGSLFALLDPAARSAPYNPTTQSHPPSQAPAYFALKSNIVNVYFVKITWFWVSLAWLFLLFLQPKNGPKGSSASGAGAVLTLTPKRVRGVIRYAIVTLWWVLVTQWCFGPALVDRGFRVTGGACELAALQEGKGGTREFVTSQACKAVGGEWKGGHDISGHVFILVLGSASLALELLPLVARRWGWREERRVVGKNGHVVGVEVEGGVSDEVKEEEKEEGEGVLAKAGTIVPSVVIGLSWWMLLMTAAYFHTWFEKFTGLLTAWAAIFAVYSLPRVIPSLRDLVGLPGV